MYPRPFPATIAHPSFPRTRGDVPCARQSRASVPRLPPHTRGCTGGPPAPHVCVGASPAHAGMYRWASSAARMRRGFPRTRGDVPLDAPAHGAQVRLPPHTRGCTPVRRRRGDEADASPAHAGMYRNSAHRSRAPSGFPRTRGDVPYPMQAALIDASLPPHTRGCTRSAHHPARRPRASPAHAGMYLVELFSTLAQSSFPRTRGDVPVGDPGAAVDRELPPHTRGCTLDSAQIREISMASPAHAGMYPAVGPANRPVVGFPRTRGDVPLLVRAAAAAAALPPHTRGCTGELSRGGGAACASPAHAGMYPQEHVEAVYGGGFPRTRGDVPMRPFSAST